MAVQEEKKEVNTKTPKTQELLEEKKKMESQSSSITICQRLLNRRCTAGVIITPIASLAFRVKKRNAVISVIHVCAKSSIQ